MYILLLYKIGFKALLRNLDERKSVERNENFDAMATCLYQQNISKYVKLFDIKLSCVKDTKIVIFGFGLLMLVGKSIDGRGG